jgi:hypothetical protein
MSISGDPQEAGAPLAHGGGHPGELHCPNFTSLKNSGTIKPEDVWQLQDLSHCACSVVDSFQDLRRLESKSSLGDKFVPDLRFPRASPCLWADR